MGVSLLGKCGAVEATTLQEAHHARSRAADPMVAHLVMRIESARRCPCGGRDEHGRRGPRSTTGWRSRNRRLQPQTAHIRKDESERRTEHEQRPDNTPNRGDGHTGLALITGPHPASAAPSLAGSEPRATTSWLWPTSRSARRAHGCTPDVEVRPLVADLGLTPVWGGRRSVRGPGPHRVVNNAGVAHYMPFVELSADKSKRTLHVKVVAPTMLTRAAAPGMVTRGEGTIINVSGMLAFSGPASLEELPLRRAVYTATLAHIVALSQACRGARTHGLQVQALCPASSQPSSTNAKDSTSAPCHECQRTTS